MAGSFYVDLDCLLDLRLGVLLLISDDYGYQVSTQERYYTRVSDHFSAPGYGALNRVLYDQILTARRGDALRCAVATKIGAFMRRMLAAQKIAQADSPIKLITELHINVHGYGLTDAEQEAIRATYADDPIYGGIPVQVIDTPYEALTCDIVLERYSALIMYNPAPWIEVNKDDFLKNKLVHVTLYSPRINHVRALSQTEIQKAQQHHIDYHTALSTAMKACIQLTHLGVHVFSADTPINTEDVL